MFLRRCRRRKDGKRHVYWALVESIRTAAGSRQRVVAYLGDLQRKEASGWMRLGRRLDGRARPEPSLFDPPRGPEPEDDLELVRVKGLRLDRVRDFGDVWLAWGLWRLLGLDDLLSRRMPSGREEVPCPRTVRRQNFSFFTSRRRLLAMHSSRSSTEAACRSRLWIGRRDWPDGYVQTQFGFSDATTCAGDRYCLSGKSLELESGGFPIRQSGWS